MAKTIGLIFPQEKKEKPQEKKEKPENGKSTGKEE